MKLGSLKEGGRDGTLVVVSRDLSQAVRATGIASTLQQALEDWSIIPPRLVALSDALNDGTADGAFELDVAAMAAPLPRAYEFVDGRAYLPRSEEHTSALQSLMRIQYAVVFLEKTTQITNTYRYKQSR